ncbi:hydroxyethylthiazole kinase [Hathewaya histolytica]|uniref:Hydroxyethylthiazole kinase n=1 Tax=Hathewaya histolytica TaxID=1498 RepID=A0A4U9R0I8_HATHI|nr:hydroxyethylthiazole kinase [Hathewaya histolytica]VTQ84479.1 hydroxyethylthiazole kinase [Hathewaya histolytica]
MEINRELLKECSNKLYNLKEKNPLVHHITNYVTVNDCANITLAIGASPVMADDINEVQDMVSIASSLVINIGTLNSRTVDAMLKAGERANELNIPIVLDPVGVGATKYRTEVARKLLDKLHFTVVRGNMSEIKMLSGLKSEIKGVDSSESLDGAEEIAKNLALKLNSVVAITGEIDYISDGKKLVLIKNGHATLSKVTGTGCMSSSLIGSFTAINKDGFIGAISGIMAMGIAGEKALESLKANEGIGTFRVRIFDNIYNLKEEDFRERGKVFLL